MLRCRDLLSLPTLSKAKLITGDKGLDNGIRWSYKAENMDFAEWVHGQELLVVSTSVINSANFDLHELVKEAIRLKLSGVLLLIGEDYISSIARNTIALAERNAFPIFTLPGNTPLVDIFEELGHAIVYQERSILNHDDLLSEVVFGKKIDEKAFVRRAALMGYEIDGPQRIFMIHVDFPAEMVTQGCVASLAAQLETMFWNQECKVMVSHFNYNIVGMTSEKAEEKISAVFQEFMDDLQERDAGLKCQIGVGSSYEEVNALGESFTEASSSLKLAHNIQWYEQLGFMRLLIGMENQKPARDYMYQIIGKIIEHDEKNHAELLQTLICYFDCNESMKDVATAMFIHPNTVKYRLVQIQEFSGLSLAISHEKMQLYNAVQIWKIV